MMHKTLIVVAVVLACSHGAAVGQPGLVGHWDFNEGQDRILRDSSGRGNHGEIRGARYAGG